MIICLLHKQVIKGLLNNLPKQCSYRVISHKRTFLIKENCILVSEVHVGDPHMLGIEA